MSNSHQSSVKRDFARVATLAVLVCSAVAADLGIPCNIHIICCRPLMSPSAFCRNCWARATHIMQCCLRCRPAWAALHRTGK